MLKKFYIFSLILFLSSVFFQMPVYAQEKTYTYIIDDEADLLTSEEEDELYTYIEPLLEYGNVIFSTVTLSSSNYEEYAENTYYQNFKNDPGVIFQIDMGNRKLTLSASTEMETLIGKERDSIVDNIYKKATNGNYFDCAAECFREINVVLNDGKIAHTMKYIDNAIIAFILALIINFIFVFRKGNKKVYNDDLIVSPLGSILITNATIKQTRMVKVYSPQPKSSGHSGGFSGGGGSHGGGGFSGGSSSHGF